MITLLLVVIGAEATVLGTQRPVLTPPPALTQDAALSAQHTGYVQYLAAHPAVEKVERAWWSRMRDAQFRYADRAFDESLVGDIVAESRLDRFYDRLYADQGATAIVESLSRIEYTPTDLAPLFSDSIREFRADPAAAIAQLQAEEGTEIPDALSPMLGYLSENPGVLNELLIGLQGVTENPLNLAELAPWWAQAAQTERGTGAAYAGLTAHFADEPEAFWDWHRRNLALAADAQARDWIRYWHRLVRRTPGLADPYYAWLLGLHDPIQAPKGAGRDIDDWPPKTAPPELQALPSTQPLPSAALEESTRNNRLSVPRPTRYQVQRPSRPTASSRTPSGTQRPTPPKRPTRPSAR